MKVSFSTFLRSKTALLVRTALAGSLVFLGDPAFSQLPAITSFSPASGPAGTSVVITGSNFSTTASQNTVWFGAARAIVSSATTSQLTVTVPAGATFEPISVTSSGLTGWSDAPFYVTFTSTLSVTGNSFAPGVGFTPGLFPTSVAFGDLDRDGKPDIVVADYNENTVSVFRNLSAAGAINAASLASPVKFTTGQNPSSVKLADLDGDGRLEIAVTNYSSHTVSVLRNTSTVGAINSLSFSAKVDFATGTNPRKIAIGDIDVDGKPDLLTANATGPGLSILRNTSSPGAISSSSFAAKVDFAYDLLDVTLGDIDMDGKVDVVVGRGLSSTPKISILRNVSTAGAISTSSLALPKDFDINRYTTQNGVGVADLNGDSKPDIAVINYNSGDKISIFKNESTSGTISLSARVDITTSSFPKSIAIADLDGDERPDLTVSSGGSTVLVYRNLIIDGTISTGSFASGVSFSAANFVKHTIVGDADGDGKPDIISVVANTLPDVSILYVFRNVNNLNSPVLAAASSVSENSFMLSWNAIEGATDYFLDVSVDNFSTFITGYQNKSVGNVTATSVTSLQPGATYQCRLRAANETGSSVSSAVLSVATLAAEPGAQPTSFLAEAVSNTQIDLSFSSASSIANAYGYIILRRQDGANPGVSGIQDGVAPASLSLPAGTTLAANITSSSTTAFNNTGLTVNVQYNYLIIPYSYNGSDVASFNYKTDGDLKTAFATPVYSSSSDMITNLSFQHPANIDYSLYIATPLKVAEFIIRDGGGTIDPDNAATTVNSITFAVLGVQYLREIYLFVGEIQVKSLIPTHPAIFSGLNLSAADNGSLVVSVRVRFNPSVVDNEQLAFSVSGISTASNSSKFALTNGGGASSSRSADNNRIEVSATKVIFTAQPPAILIVNTDVSPAPLATAVDALNNVDLDYSAQATVSNSSTLSMINTPTDFSSGVLAFPAAFQFTSYGMTRLQVASGSLQQVSSNEVIVRAEAPASQPTELAFNGITTTSMDVAFVAASGLPEGYLVLRREGSPPTEVPVDGTEYAASSTLGTSRVVHATASTSFLSDGLSASIVYYYAVYAYNGSGAAINYLTDAPLAGSRSTLSSEPGLQPTQISFSSVSENGMSGTFTAVAESPDGYIVLMREGQSPDDVPVDGNAYAAGNSIGNSLVVFVGTETNFFVSGLTPGIEYFFDVFSFNGTTQTYNYLTASPLEGDRSTLAAEPLAQSSAISFSTVADQSLSVSFMPPATGADGYLCLLRAGSSPTETPLDATHYEPGHVIGTSLVVYSGPATTFSLEGLTPATVYYFDIFSYNGTTGTLNYLTASPLEGIKSTLLTEPAGQATNVVYSNLTATAMTVSWTNSTGAERLLVGRSDFPITELPQDGVSYIGSSEFTNAVDIGDGHKILYRGAASSVRVTGLAAHTTYHFQVFELNGTGDQTNYLTVTNAGNPSSKSTLASEPGDQPTSILFTGITHGGATVSFTGAAGSPTGYLALRRAANPSSDVPSDGVEYSKGHVLGSSTVAHVGPETIFTESGVNPGTAYYYTVYSYNGATDTYNYLTADPLVGNYSTLITEPQGQATTISFSNITPTSMTVGWTNGGGTERLLIGSESFPVLEHPVDGTSYAADPNFPDAFDFGNGHKVLYRGTASSVNITGLNPSTVYYFQVFEFNGNGGQTNYLTVANTGNPSSKSTLAPEPGDQPTGIQFTNVVQAGMTVSFVAASTAPTAYIALRRAGSAPSDAPIDGVEYAAGQTIVSSTVAYVGAEQHFDDTGLSPGTLYHYAVYSVNGTTGTWNYLTTSPLVGNQQTTQPAEFKISPPLFDPRFSVSNKISVEVTGARGPLTVTMRSRKIAGSVRNAYPATQKAGAPNVFQVSIAEEMADELGVEFYFEAYDGLGTIENGSRYFIYRSIDASANVSIPFASGFNGKTNTYQIFSIPYDLTDKNIDNLFDVALDGPDNTRWRLFHFQDNSLREYPKQFRQIELGKGYWFNTIKNDFSVVLGAATVAEANQTADFQLPLAPGWNQIGNPYPFNISWSAVTAGNDKIGSLWFFNNGAYAKSDVFKPWTGAFVHADEAMTLAIPVLAKTNASGRTKEHIAAVDLDAEQWMLPLTLRIGGLQHLSGVGMHPEAKASKDRFDEIAIPRFLDYAEMYTHHEEFFSPHFSTDVVPAGKEQTWIFDVKSNLEDQQGELTWDHHSIAANKSSLILIDLLEGKWVDMKTTGTYSFRQSDGRQFKVVYNREGEIKPGITLLGEAYPNPFTSEVRIPLLIDEPGLKQIEIYDGLGRVVQRIRAHFAQRGIQQIIWDTRETKGQEISSGMFYYRLLDNRPHKVKRLIKK